MTFAAEFDDHVRKASGEQSLNGIGLTDVRSMREVVWAAFVDEVAPWAELEYEQDVNPRRVAERLERARGSIDFLVVADPARLDSLGLLQPVQHGFESSYPQGWIDGSRRWQPLYVQPTVVIFNRLHVDRPPETWTAMADPRWAGRMVFDAPWRMVTSGPTFAELQGVLGTDGWSDLMAGLARVGPHLVADNERSVLEVATGHDWLGLSIWNVARRVRPGSPVELSFLDPTPVIPGFLVMARDAPHRHLATLFHKWLASPDGQRAYAETGRIPALPGVEAPTALQNVLPPGVEPVFGQADWVTNSPAFVSVFRDLFPEPTGGLPEGKLR